MDNKKEFERLMNFSVKQLRAGAKSRKIPKYTSLKKDELIRAMFPELEKTKVKKAKEPKHLKKARKERAKKTAQIYEVSFKLLSITHMKHADGREYNLFNIKDYVLYSASQQELEPTRIFYELDSKSNFVGSLKSLKDNIKSYNQERYRIMESGSDYYQWVNPNYLPNIHVNLKTRDPVRAINTDDSSPTRDAEIPHAFASTKTDYYSELYSTYREVGRPNQPNILLNARGLKRISYFTGERSAKYSCFVDGLLSCGFKTKLIDEFTKQNFQKNYNDKSLRISAQKIIDFVESHSGRVHFLDLFNRTVYKTDEHTLKSKFKKYKSLIGFLNHNHVSIVTDDKMKKSVVNTANLEMNKRVFDATAIKMPTEVTKEIVPLTRPLVEKELIKHIKQQKISVKDLKIKFTKGLINKFETNTHLYINMDENVLEMMKDIHGYDSIDTLAAMACRKFTEFVNSHKLTQTIDKIPDELKSMVNFLQGRNYKDDMHETNIEDYSGMIVPDLMNIIGGLRVGAKRYCFNELDAVKAIDQNKAYSSILRNIRNFRPTVFSKLNKYNSDNILPGIYFINTNDFYLFKGNGEYSDKVIKLAINEGIEFECEYYINCEVSETDVFRNFVDYMHQVYGERVGGRLVNHFIGCSNKKSTEMIKAAISYSPIDVYHYYEHQDTLGGDFSVNILANEIGDEKEDLYLIKSTVSRKSFKTRVGIYVEVLSDSHINNYHKMKSLGLNNIVYINTDCIGLNKIAASKSDDELDVRPGMGHYKYEEVKDVCNLPINGRLTDNIYMTHVYDSYKDSFLVDQAIDLQNDDDKQAIKALIADNRSILINGRSGSGKTTLIKQELDELKANGDNRKQIRIAPTNIAARLIDGDTIHSHFDSHFAGLSTNQIKQFNNTIIWIDECSMLDQAMVQILYLVKRQSNAKFIITGDFAQLPPVVEMEPLENSHVLYELCDQRRCILSKIFRYDFNYDDVKILTATADNFIKMDTPRAIVVTNKLRLILTDRVLREKYNIIRQDDDKTKITLPVQQFHPGMPLVCTKNAKVGPKAASPTIFVPHYNNVPYKYEGCCVIENVLCVNIRNMLAIDSPIVTYEFNYFTKNFDYGFASTSYKSQGQSYDFPYMIFESEKMNDKHKYVAVTRSRQLRNILNSSL